MAQQFVGDRSVDALAADLTMLYAAVRALEIVSEASRRLRGEQQDRFPNVPWRLIEDAGNVYRHGYDVMLVDRVHDTAIRSTPHLLAAALIALDDPSA